MMILATNWVNAGLMALVSIALVFSVLVLLIFVLKLFGVIFKERKSAAPAPAALAPIPAALVPTPTPAAVLTLAPVALKF